MAKRASHAGSVPEQSQLLKVSFQYCDETRPPPSIGIEKKATELAAPHASLSSSRYVGEQSELLPL